jgi:hypothetical protein
MLERRSEDLPPESPDGLTQALDDLASIAERASEEQQLLAARARAMSEQRRRGESCTAILGNEGHQPILALLGTNLARLTHTSSRFRLAVATSLAKEGHSTRQIASRLGVTHQRVSAMLNRARS